MEQKHINDQCASSPGPHIFLLLKKTLHCKSVATVKKDRHIVIHNIRIGTGSWNNMPMGKYM